MQGLQGLGGLFLGHADVDEEVGQGHRLVGGMRASIYNAMPPEGIDKLVDFMEKFRKEH